MLFFPTTEEDAAYFRSQGYTGSINDMHFKALGDSGYTGSLNDRIRACLTFKYGSYYEAMKDLRNGTSVFALSPYIINGFDPALVFDFKGNYFRKSATASTFGASITHAATTNATMVDSDGLLKWRPHNFVDYSEDFTNSSWTKDNVSITANATTAPDGTLTADLITENSATGLHRVYNQITLVEGTRSCFFKYAGSTQWVYVVSGSNTASWVNIQTGVLGTIGAGTTTSVTDHGDGWYELSVYKDGASIYAIYNLANADGVTSYTGDGTSGAYIWGPHALSLIHI